MKSSYQKLKEERDELLGDIYKLVKHKNDVIGLITFVAYNIRFCIEENALKGEAKKKDIS